MEKSKEIVDSDFSEWASYIEVISLATTVAIIFNI